MGVLVHKDFSPIFIGGMFKSGTSLLRAMIGNHSLVATGLETYWFDLDWRNLGLPQYQERLRIMGEFYELSQKEIIHMVEGSSCAEVFLSKLMSGWAKRENKIRWAEKTPGNVMHIDRICGFWPEAKVIHIVRDPRDIFASMREAGKWDTIDLFMERWSAVFRSIERFNQLGLLQESNYLEIRYEELVREPKREMQTVCEFCQLPYEVAIASFNGKKDDFEKVKAVTGKESTTLARLAQPIITDRLSIWKTVLNPTEIQGLADAAEHAGLTRTYLQACR